jgi:putative molybdopterin biosynthesis protein
MMRSIDQIQQLKVLGDSQRLAILRRLMAGPATLSQLGEFFQETPAHIRHHLKSLEHAGFVELDSVNLVRNLWEKYYRASSAAYQVNLVILPESPAGRTPLVIGSNDVALKRIQAGFSQKNSGLNPIVLSLDSLDGLVKLREGICRMATCHLLDADSAEYNRSFVRHLFPGKPMALVKLFRREGGLLLPPGNPKQIRGLEDLARAGVRMLNRESGSGIRVWLDYQLGRLGIPASNLEGYQNEVFSHLEVARAIYERRADAGLGLPASASEFGLEFIPLFEEPYDLALSQETLADDRLSPFFDQINSEEFRQAVEKNGGYRAPADSGRVDLVS